MDFPDRCWTGNPADVVAASAGKTGWWSFSEGEVALTGDGGVQVLEPACKALIHATPEPSGDWVSRIWIVERGQDDVAWDLGLLALVAEVVRLEHPEPDWQVTIRASHARTWSPWDRLTQVSQEVLAGRAVLHGLLGSLWGSSWAGDDDFDRWLEQGLEMENEQRSWRSWSRGLRGSSSGTLLQAGRASGVWPRADGRC